MTNLVQKLKKTNQDFEWYPTTDEMIDAVVSNIPKEHYSAVLDIGAGDGRVLNKIKEKSNVYKTYVIEKSQPLIARIRKDVIMWGTGFQAETLIDIKKSILFF